MSAAAMKSTLQSAVTSAGRLVCSRCGLAADPGAPEWRALTAVSHAGPNVAAERAGHEVALDLCRGCMRETLRAALGIRPHGARAAGAARARHEAPPAAPLPRFDAVCSLADAEAFISRCCARIDALRRDEPSEPEHCNCHCDAWAPRFKAAD
jgi:hypothetical protein